MQPPFRFSTSDCHDNKYSKKYFSYKISLIICTNILLKSKLTTLLLAFKKQACLSTSSDSSLYYSDLWYNNPLCYSPLYMTYTCFLLLKTAYIWSFHYKMWITYIISQIDQLKQVSSSKPPTHRYIILS